MSLFCLSSLAGTKNISCSNGSCSYSENPSVEKLVNSFIYMDFGGLNRDNFFINGGLQQQDSPNNVFLTVLNNNVGSSLSIDLSSKNSTSNAGNFILISDYFRSLDVKLNGFVGADGEKASVLCSNEFYKGDDGFGSVSKEKYLERRLYNAEIPQNQCTMLDLDYLRSNNFSCDDGFSEINHSTQSVLVNRLKGKYRCLGVAYANICLSETVRITCVYRVKYTGPAGVANTYDMTDSYKQERIFTIPKLQYEEMAASPDFASKLRYACDVYSYKSGAKEPSNMVINNEFNFNVLGWDGKNFLFDSEKLKLSGSIQLDSSPNAYQIFNTEPNISYRVKATWNKDLNYNYVSTGSVKVFNDENRSQLNTMVNVFEAGSIPKVFVTSDDTPYSFGMIKAGDKKVQRINIVNKDIRSAKNCGAVIVDNTSYFSIVSSTCTNGYLNSGESCYVDIEAKTNISDQLNGKKESKIKMICSDEYGNNSSALDESISFVLYRDYIQPESATSSVGWYDDKQFWRYVVEENQWQKCRDKTSLGFMCTNSSPVKTIGTDCSSIYGSWCYSSIAPANMGYQEVTPLVKEYKYTKQSEVDPSLRFNSKNIDFVFKATSFKTVLELSTILPYHNGYFDNISLTRLSEFSGPNPKPPADKNCPNAGFQQGCVSGSAGFGYYDLDINATNVPIKTVPGYNEQYYTVPPESDHRIIYVKTTESCPTYFQLIKSNYLLGNISYDENDQLCDDVSIKEDPTSRVVKWSLVGYDRMPEFGTEMIQCSVGNCLVDYSVVESEKNLKIINLGSGGDGTIQGSGQIFLYDVNSMSLSSSIGKGGTIGTNDMKNYDVYDYRSCVKIYDSSTQGINSEWAKNPKVLFKNYLWRPVKFTEAGNYGKNPQDNGKKINIYKKTDSSLRYLLQQELSR